MFTKRTAPAKIALASAGSRFVISPRFQFPPRIVAPSRRLSLRNALPNSALDVRHWALDVFPLNPAQQLPDSHGHFGSYGGMFVPETLISAINDLAAEYERA